MCENSNLAKVASLIRPEQSVASWLSNPSYFWKNKDRLSPSTVKLRLWGFIFQVSSGSFSHLFLFLMLVKKQKQTKHRFMDENDFIDLLPTYTNTCDQDIVFMMVQLIVRGLLPGPHHRIYSVLFISICLVSP